MSLGPQIATGTTGLTCLLPPPPTQPQTRSLAVSPWSVQGVHWLVSLGRGRWSAGWGVVGEGGDECGFGVVSVRGRVREKRRGVHRLPQDLSA
ncbi:MAG: hypothetical protein GY832_39400 [Chloroflexi bacterium]|nr:hypothetical protein [Chloroflexota bacterium]